MSSMVDLVERCSLIHPPPAPLSSFLRLSSALYSGFVDESFLSVGGDVGDDNLDRGGQLEGGTGLGSAGRAPQAVDRLVLCCYRHWGGLVREGCFDVTNDVKRGRWQ